MKENGVNFIIVAPAYHPCSGGIVALHKLCHQLSLLGENAFIYSTSKNENYLGTLILPSTKMIFDDDNTVVIYPEIIQGNPLNVKHVVRWFLNTPGTNNDMTFVFENTDLVYRYSEAYGWGSARRQNNDSTINGILTVMDVDFDVFQDKHQKRSGDCYLVRKGKIGTLHRENSVCIDNFFERGYAANEYLSQVFNSTERFISYDPHTFLSVQAALCGCTSIVAPYDLSFEEWMRTEPYTDGIAYGLDDIKRAQETQPALVLQLNAKIEQSVNTVFSFIKDIYTYLGI